MRFIFCFLLTGCVDIVCSTEDGIPDTAESAIVYGTYPEASGCYVVYYDKQTQEVTFELQSIDNEGSNFCLTGE